MPGLLSRRRTPTLQTQARVPAGRPDGGRFDTAGPLHTGVPQHGISNPYTSDPPSPTAFRLPTAPPPPAHEAATFTPGSEAALKARSGRTGNAWARNPNGEVQHLGVGQMTFSSGLWGCPPSHRRPHVMFRPTGSMGVIRLDIGTITFPCV